MKHDRTYKLSIHPSQLERAELLAAHQPEYKSVDAILHLMINKSLDRYLMINEQAQRLKNGNAGPKIVKRYLLDEIARLTPRSAEEFLAAYQKEAA